MTDPFSVAVGVVSIVSTGLKACSGLLKYCDSVKDAEFDVSTTRRSLETLLTTLNILHEKIHHPLHDRKTVDLVSESIISCALGVQKLESKLKKIAPVKKRQGKLDKIGPVKNLQDELDQIGPVKPDEIAFWRRAVYPFHEQTLVKLRQIISNLQHNLDSAVNALQLDVGTQVLHNQDQERLRQKRTEEQHAIDWLSPLESVAKQNDIFNTCQPGTGQWLLESPKFCSWKGTAGKVLWCPGMPGAGKTILVSTAIDYLEQEFRQTQTGIAYVYCLYDERQQTATNLLGSLLQQLANQNDAVKDDIIKCHSENTRDRTRPTLRQISDLLGRQVKNFDKVFIIIDALDECPEAGKVRLDFLTEIRRLQPEIRLMVTSQHIPSIECDFKQAMRLEICADDQDVRKFIEAKIEQRGPGGLSDVLMDYDAVKLKSLKDLIVTTVLEKTNGMFLFAKLHMELLSGLTNIRDIREKLQDLPRDRDELFAKTLERIRRQNDERLAQAEQVLTFINCAFRPLKKREIQYMVSIRAVDTCPDPEALSTVDSLLSVCCGLVVVEDESQIVRLIHATAGEYFKAKKLYRNPESHCMVAGVLVTYLSFTTFASFDLDGMFNDANPRPESGWEEDHVEGVSPFDILERGFQYLLEKNVLLLYAAENWGEHAREALADFSARGAEDSTPFHSMAADAQRRGVKTTWDLKQIIPTLLKKASNMLCAYQVLWWIERFRYSRSMLVCGPTKLTDLHIVAKFGIYSLVKEYLENRKNIGARDSAGQTALHYAAINGHTDIVQLLLDSGCSIGAKDAWSDTALDCSIVAGRLSVVRLLLEKGSRPRAPRGWRDLPAMIAAEKGHGEVLELLAEYEANQLERDKFMGQALVDAAGTGQEGVVRLLMDSGKSWNISKQHLASAISSAAGFGSSIIVQILLDAVNSFPLETSTALGAATSDGHGESEVTQSLLAAGADANATDEEEDDHKPLHQAVMGGHADVVALLLKARADVDAPDRSNDSLMVALTKDGYGGERAEILQQLLKSGADPTARDEQFGRTSLEWSILQGYQASVEILLDCENADLARRNSMLQLTKIYRAVRSKSDKANLDQLLSQIEIPCLKTMPELLLLCIPAENGSERVVRLFLDLGATIEARDAKGKTVLHVASEEGHAGIVQLLVDAKADVNAKDPSGWTPLMGAAFRGWPSIVSILLDNGAQIDTEGDYLGTALAQAVRNGRRATAKLLLDRGADANIETSGKRRDPLLHLAVGAFDRSRYPYLLEILLEKGCGLESKDRFGQTPLVTAVSYSSNVNAARLLLEKGADPESKDDKGQTPLILAIRTGESALAQLLVEKGAYLESKDDKDQTPLILAIRTGQISLAHFLVEKGAHLESKDDKDQTPLILAAQYGQIALAQLLLEKGAHLESKDRYDQTPLFLAARYGKIALAQLLLEKGAHLESKDRHGHTPLMLAAAFGQITLVQLLLEKGADLESKDGLGQTALVMAVRGGEVDVTQILLDKGANPHALSHTVTPLAYWLGEDGSDVAVDTDKDGFAAAVKLVMEAKERWLDKITTDLRRL